MNLFFRRLWLGLTKNAAATASDAEDPRLRGRTYGIPFEDVWRAACSLANGGLRDWGIIRTDDEEGVIQAEASTRLSKAPLDIHIRISLDYNAQTRVDMRSSSRTGRADFGANARQIGRFFEALDATLERSRYAGTAGRAAS